MKIRSILLGGALAFTVALGSAASATEYLTNGSFENGIAGWTFSGNTGYFSVPCGNGGAQNGQCYVHQGPVGSDGILSQSFTDVAGEALTISGYVNGNGASFSHVQYYFDGNLVFDTGNPTPNTGGYTRYSALVTATGSDTFDLHFRNDPGYSDLDNFSVASGAVPEPATWAMMLVGFGGLGTLLRRRRGQVALTA
jgi:hypothetical protein